MYSANPLPQVMHCHGCAVFGSFMILLVISSAPSRYIYRMPFSNTLPRHCETLHDLRIGTFAGRELHSTNAEHKGFHSMAPDLSG